MACDIIYSCTSATNVSATWHTHISCSINKTACSCQQLVVIALLVQALDQQWLPFSASFIPNRYSSFISFVPCRKLGSPKGYSSGRNNTAIFYQSVSSTFLCPNNGMAASVWEFEHARRCWCMRLHTGVDLHVCEQVRSARSVGNSAIENLCIIII